jgi:hypothetical protein
LRYTNDPAADPAADRADRGEPLAVGGGGAVASARPFLNSPRYLRWMDTSENEEGEAIASVADGASPRSAATFELQTAVRTFARGGSNSNEEVVELHAQVHMAEAEYYAFYNSNEFNGDKCAVLYELLLDEQLLNDVDGSNLGNRVNNDRKRRKILSDPIQASHNDQRTAQQCGWVCQADTVQYSQRNWIHADFTRQEFLQRQQEQQQATTSSPSSVDSKEPLWKLGRRNQRSEAATALLVGPPVLLSGAISEKRQKRRIFTNLFLPGDSLAIFMRLVLWVTVPSPEISVLLLDWSSSWFLTYPINKPINSQISQIVLPIVKAVSNGRIDQVRQLIWGQVLVAGHAASSMTIDNENSVLIGQRNYRALELLLDQLENRSSPNSNKNQKIALLYGCNHCPDLHVKLVRAGFVPIKMEWRTAWSIEKPSSGGRGSNNYSDGNSIGNLFAFAVPIYLVLGGADWIGTLQDIGNAADNQEEGLMVGLSLFYVFRHVLMYVGLSKLVLDFSDNGKNSFD